MKAWLDHGRSVLDAYRRRLALEQREGGEGSPALKRAIKELLDRLGDEAIKRYRERLIEEEMIWNGRRSRG